MVFWTVGILFALFAPFVIHELGHYAVLFFRMPKWARPYPWKFFRWDGGFRLIWTIPAGLNRRETREILIAGFVAEILGSALFALGAIWDVRMISLAVLYTVVAAGHLWHYAVNPGKSDDLLNLSLYKD